MVEPESALGVGSRITRGHAAAEILKPLEVTVPRFPGRLYVGLTGGMGAGKTEVARMWAGLGATVFSADEIAREVVEPGTEGLEAVVEAFGLGILRPDGSLDRAALGALVFEDAEARRTLEAITHPLIARAARQVVMDARTELVIYDVPLLVEANMRYLFDLAVVVDASVELRLKRLEGRGVPGPEARRRLSAQATREERLAVADIWIENNGSQRDLAAVATEVFENWLVPFSKTVL